jgi:hypothetical protein
MSRPNQCFVEIFILLCTLYNWPWKRSIHPLILSIAMWNILTQHFVQTFLFLKHRIKHFVSVITSAQVSSLLSRSDMKCCKAGICLACWYSKYSFTLNAPTYQAAQFSWTNVWVWFTNCKVNKMTCGLYYKHILTIVNDACTINV